MRDSRGLEITAADDEAVRGLDRVMERYTHFAPDTGECLKGVFAADSKMALAHCIKGFFLMLFCVPALVGKAASSSKKARQSVEERGATEREKSHIEALDAWIRGDLRQAISHWEAILARHPHDLLALKLAHYMHFYVNGPKDMQDSIQRVLPAWDEGVEGYAQVVGMHAFALEECGDYAEAERAGRWAAALDPADLWAVHAVAHVMESEDRRREGIDWISAHESQIERANNFSYHLWWHQALFYLGLEDYEAVLSLYDRRIRADRSDEYLDLCNAASLLWRLEEGGVGVGDRWDELADRCEGRIGEHLLIFADTHYMLALAARGRSVAETMIESMERFAQEKVTEGEVAGEVGAALCRAWQYWYCGQRAKTVDILLPIRERISLIGGSHAQRDLFHQLLIRASIEAGRYDIARDLLARRVIEKPRNLWSWRKYAQVLGEVDEGVEAESARRKVEALSATASGGIG
ncbi:tetratricopeptide repeat protein [Thioalkalivibrio sp. HK1]|uniref:tetratricopeptide repeat protein n=1 Tax=Thioalkalivibrio sp. HK1 TaxID=1469245 RepID=UPI0004701A1E|nr:tetratricopeptide repeat protein [Thioalkalivibrio sp. HK1]